MSLILFFRFWGFTLSSMEYLVLFLDLSMEYLVLWLVNKPQRVRKKKKNKLQIFKVETYVRKVFQGVLGFPTYLATPLVDNYTIVHRKFYDNPLTMVITISRQCWYESFLCQERFRDTNTFWSTLLLEIKSYFFGNSQVFFFINGNSQDYKPELSIYLHNQRKIISIDALLLQI